MIHLKGPKAAEKVVSLRGLKVPNPKQNSPSEKMNLTLASGLKVPNHESKILVINTEAQILIFRHPEAELKFRPSNDN